MTNTFIEGARLLSAVAFLGFGTACLVTRRMREEFERYGLARWRLLVGRLELAGAVGLLAGPWWPRVAVAAAAGLALLMALGVATRVRIRDSLAQTLPAALLFVTNVIVALGTS